MYQSLSARRAWIEIQSPTSVTPAASRSLSARRAWIEIGVDFAEDWLDAVALRKESVDRNVILPGRLGFLSFVALRKESVDRNVASVLAVGRGGSSLSARRAWIEITYVTRLPRAQVCRSPQGERG